MMAFKHMSLWTSGWVYLLSSHLGPDWLRPLKTFLRHFFLTFFHGALQMDQSQAVISYCEFLLVLHISECVPFLWIILALYWGTSEAIDCLEMCVYIYISICLCVYIYMCINICFIYIYVYLYVYIHLWLILLF